MCTVHAPQDVKRSLNLVIRQKHMGRAPGVKTGWGVPSHLTSVALPCFVIHIDTLPRMSGCVLNLPYVVRRPFSRLRRVSSLMHVPGRGTKNAEVQMPPFPSCSLGPPRP